MPSPTANIAGVIELPELGGLGVHPCHGKRSLYRPRIETTKSRIPRQPVATPPAELYTKCGLRNTSVEALDGQFQWQEVGLGERTFDRLGRLVGMDWRVNQALSDRTVYDYDSAGRRVKRTLEDGSYWEYGYDDLGQLTVASRLLSEQKVLPGSQFEYEYDDLGNRKKAWMGGEFDPNGLYDASYTADVLNRYTQRDVPGYAEIVGRSESTVVQVNGVTASREGDFYHRQVSVNNANAAAQLDVAVLEVPGDLTERQLFFAGDPEEFEYDDDGNMTLDGIWSYEWDAENRLKAMQMRPEIAEVRLAGTDPWVRLEFEYDWGGRRIAKRYLTATQSQVTHEGGGVYTIAWDRPLRQNFVYDGWHLSASYRTKDDGEYLSVDQSYAWGPDLSDSPGGAGGIGGLAIYQDDLADSDGGTYIGPMFPSYDGNGNVVALYRLAPSSLTVQAAARYDYGPFGEALGLVGKQAHRFPFRWSTKFTDAETGLVYYGYRYYHPSLGRWISRDPIGERDGPNVFQITRGNPAMHVDPFGLYTNEHGEPNCGPCDRSLPGYRFATEYSQSKEDWQRDALLFAGIHPSLWLTFAEGWVHDTFNRTEHHAGSRFVLTRVYRGYANFFYQRPQELLWSGAAALAGVGVLNNLRDLDRIHDGGRDRAVSWATGPLRRSFIRMAKAVYDDMAWQHLAYLNAGLGELRALVDSGDIPEEVFFDGWCRIAYGDVQDGNLTLLKYEQLDVLQPHFSALRRTYGPLLVEEMSRRASSDGVPGTMTFREYDPNGDITKFTQRWGWVQHEVMRQWFMFSDDMRVHIVYANTPR
ncbi:MAG: RHS repeat-associated core domain-containing protein [Phycisphaeraceae bacterium]|nr:RHS repeat-associated core domain-containing protein [Phycisphaeraceae bacterium]